MSKEVVLSWSSRVPWESYIGDGKAREGSSIVVTMEDVRIIKRYCEADQGAAMTEALAKDEVRRQRRRSLESANKWRRRLHPSVQNWFMVT